MAEERLDVLVARQAGITRSRAEKLIREGRVQVGEKVITKAGFKVDDGITDVCVDLPPIAPNAALPENIPVDILYEDEDMAVINKPAGLVVHPAAGNAQGTLVNALLFQLDGLSGIGGVMRPGIVHRLDKDTSGVMLVAKNDRAHVALSEALKAREIHKTYRAMVLGGFREDAGEIEAPIARHTVHRKRMAVVQGGRPAKTLYRVAQVLRGATLLDVDLITGRTHQIRVHMASIGHPILGDPIYGGKKQPLSVPRLMLHAWQISLLHPVTGVQMTFEAPEPDDFTQVRRRLMMNA